MIEPSFWDQETEIRFFSEAMENAVSVEKLFYRLQKGYFAYIPKGEDSERQTLQSRNALIGRFTEAWSRDFFQPIANSLGLFAVNGVVCHELGLTQRSDADLAFCTTDETWQKTENIKLLFEIKMSIMNNYQFSDGDCHLIGDYNTHRGSPSIQRSDSMLKVIGKSINIRVSDAKAAKIPIIILANSPIAKSYSEKVDFLKKAGVVQGFVSVYPNPTSDDFLEMTKGMGFLTFSDYKELSDYIRRIVNSDMEFFSSMLSKEQLGQIVRLSAHEEDDIARAQRFLSLI